MDNCVTCSTVIHDKSEKSLFNSDCLLETAAVGLHINNVDFSGVSLLLAC